MIAPPIAPKNTALTTQEKLHLYRQMVLLRRFELRAQELYKKGTIPGFIHLYVGEEATAVGVCAHLRREDWITSTHRGHGHALAKGLDPKVLMAELCGRATGCCGGRGGSMHLYEPDVGLMGTSGLVGGGIPPALGAAISARVRGTDGVAVAFFGDGAINHGAFHEAINFAGAISAPLILVCENNLYATATPLTVATRNTEVHTRGAAYGVPGVAVDGNDVLAMHEVMRQAAERARSGEGPTLIEARTYRFVGHHEGDAVVGTYRSAEEVEKWKLRCPIKRMRALLLEKGGAGEAALKAVEDEVEATIDAAVDFAVKSPQPDPATVMRHVWATPLAASRNPAAAEAKTQTWLEAVTEGTAEEMRRDPHIIYLGEGIGERGGSFAHTKGLWSEFGGHRVIDTPISELGFTGAAAGASASGCRAVADLMFADFLFEAASQIVHQAAKLRYMSNGRIGVPMVIRAPFGAIRSAGPHHSGSYYPMWAHIPGLLVVVPSNPADAKALFKAALRSGDPVLFLEPKSLFASKGSVPQGDHVLPFGQAAVVRSGGDLTIVTCGAMVQRCVQAAEQLAGEKIECEIIDLRTIVPLDVDAIVASVTKTNHLLVVDEAFASCGLGGEIAAIVQEQAFDALDAPVGRLHTEPVAHPFNPGLEEAVVITVERIVQAVRSVRKGIAPPARRLEAKLYRGESISSTPTRTIEKVESTPEHAASPAAGEVTDGIAITMPHQDLTITEATVTKWHKEVGQRVRQGEPVVEVETAKALSDIEAPADGVLARIVVGPNTTIKLGALLGVIRP